MPKKLDLTGKVYGHLTVLRQVKGNSRYLTWECRCDCGNLICVDSRHLQSGATRDCGCMKSQKKNARTGRKAEDLTGKVFGRLTVLERTENRNSLVTWKCRCSCGEITTASSHDLKTGLKKSCGCLRREGNRKMDITGNRYGNLTALYPTGKASSSGSMLWRCRCDCGNEVNVSVSDLNKGNNKSCGCLKIKYQKLVHDRLHLVDGTCVEWLESRKSRVDNVSGFRGVFRKKSGKYSVTIGFKKKIYYLGTYEELDEAIEARLRAEEKIHQGFVAAHKLWGEMAEKDPDWAAENPFRFDVSKENGILSINNSMEEYMRSTGDGQNTADSATGSTATNLLMEMSDRTEQYTDKEEPANVANIPETEEAGHEQELIHK